MATQNAPTARLNWKRRYRSAQIPCRRPARRHKQNTPSGLQPSSTKYCPFMRYSTSEPSASRLSARSRRFTGFPRSSRTTKTRRSSSRPFRKPSATARRYRASSGQRRKMLSPSRKGKGGARLLHDRGQSLAIPRYPEPRRAFRWAPRPVSRRRPDENGTKHYEPAADQRLEAFKIAAMPFAFDDANAGFDVGRGAGPYAMSQEACRLDRRAGAI
ncbi:hypothetical protein ABIC08_006386 [Bradyrhizobium sp. RT9b]